MRVVLIIPTFNECENIARLIAELQGVFRSLPHEMQILVVDDSSPDGTASIVRAQQRQMPNVHLLEGKKQGLGAAYVRGMRHALDVLHADAVFEMDADFSHRPADVPRLLAALEAGADFVIGSRYVRGGTIPKEWALHRRLNSRFGNLVARYLAGIYRVHDCTAGFRAIRNTLLRAAAAEGAKVVELPVDFVDRTAGESKLGLRDILEFLRSAAWIRFQSSRVFIDFCLVGASGVVVNLGLFTVLLALGVNKFVASPIAIQCSIVTNFFANNYWTFRRRRLLGPLHARGLRFNVVAILSLAISTLTFVILSGVLPRVAPQVHQLLGVIPATLVNYFLNSYWTFRDARSSALPSAETAAQSRHSAA